MAKPIVLRGTAIGQGRPKICVPIVGRTEKEILDKADELQTTPLDLVEWRADWYQEAACTEHTLAVLRKLREKFKKRPLLFTFRTTRGRRTGNRPGRISETKRSCGGKRFGGSDRPGIVYSF